MKKWKLVFILLIDDIIIIGIMFFILWKIGIRLPIELPIGVIVLVGIYSFLKYKYVYPALKKKPITGFESIIGLIGVVVKPLNPEGLVKVQGELWKAISCDKDVINIDEKVEIIKVEGLTLICKSLSKSFSEKLESF